MYKYEDAESAQSLIVAPEFSIPTIDQQVEAWLAQVSKSNSPRTLDGYRRTMRHFRDFLGKYRLDLDADESYIASCAELWSKEPALPPVNHRTYPSVKKRLEKMLASRGQLSPVTVNDRITVIASFYKYAKRKRWQQSNPMEMVQRYEKGEQPFAEPIEMRKVAAVLASIDKSTLLGKRDHAILQVLFNTGIRRAEVQQLLWGDLDIRSDGTAKLHVRRTKGNKSITHALKLETVVAILEYMHAIHGSDLEQIAPDTPLWVVIHHNGYTRAEHVQGHMQLHVKAFSDCFRRYFGHGKTHAARHSVGTYYDEQNAPIATIQAKLGHKHRLTTETYLQRTKPVDDKYAGDLARLLASESAPEQDSPLTGKVLAQKIQQAISLHPDWKDYKIARLLNVSPHTVKKYRS